MLYYLCSTAAPLVVAQYITTSIKEINIAVYHTNVLAIYFLDGGGGGARVVGEKGDGEAADRAVFYSDCPASYLSFTDMNGLKKKKKKKNCSVIYKKRGENRTLSLLDEQ